MRRGLGARVAGILPALVIVGISIAVAVADEAGPAWEPPTKEEVVELLLEEAPSVDGRPIFTEEMADDLVVDEPYPGFEPPVVMGTVDDPCGDLKFLGRVRGRVICYMAEANAYIGLHYTTVVEGDVVRSLPEEWTDLDDLRANGIEVVDVFAQAEELIQLQDYVPPEWTIPAGSDTSTCRADWTETLIPEVQATVCLPSGWSVIPDPDFRGAVIIRSTQKGHGFTLTPPLPYADNFGNVRCTKFVQFLELASGRAKICRMPGTQLMSGDPDRVVDSVLYPSKHVAIMGYKLSEIDPATLETVRATMLSVRETP